MRSLSPPQTDENDLFDRLRQRRRASSARVLGAARRTVLSAYDAYMVGSTSSFTSVITDENVANELRSNYSVLRSGSLAGDGAEILARSKICCLCGLRDTSELDHYLPKQIFPEYAAFTQNLVPVCGICNKTKGQEFRNGSGGPSFFHAYLDELPSSQRFLTANLIFQNVVLPQFELVRCPGMTAKTFAVLESQFERLELGTLYAEEAIELLTEKYGALGDYYAEGGSTAVGEYLSRDARSAERHYGVNHWKPTVLAAAATSAQFCSSGFKLLG